jgi:hypothetical protein
MEAFVVDAGNRYKYHSSKTGVVGVRTKIVGGSGSDRVVGQTPRTNLQHAPSPVDRRLSPSQSQKNALLGCLPTYEGYLV